MDGLEDVGMEGLEGIAAEGPAAMPDEDGEGEWQRPGRSRRARNARAAQNGQPAAAANAAARRRAPRVLVEPLQLGVVTAGGTAQNQRASLMFAVFAAQGPTGKDYGALDGKALANSLGLTFAAAMRSTHALLVGATGELDSLLASVHVEYRGVGAFLSSHGPSSSYRLQITMPVALLTRATDMVIGKGSMLSVTLPERGGPFAAVLCRGPANRMQECMLVEMTPMVTAALQAQAAAAADPQDWENCNASPLVVPDVTTEAALQALNAVPGMRVSWVGQAAELTPEGVRKFVGVQWGAGLRHASTLCLPVCNVKWGRLYALVYGPGVSELLPRRLNGSGLQHRALSWQVRTDPSPASLSVSALLYRVSLPVPARTPVQLPAAATWGARAAPAPSASRGAGAAAVSPTAAAGSGPAVQSAGGDPSSGLPAVLQAAAATAAPDASAACPALQVAGPGVMPAPAANGSMPTRQSSGVAPGAVTRGSSRPVGGQVGQLNPGGRGLGGRGQPQVQLQLTAGAGQLQGAGRKRAAVDSQAPAAPSARRSPPSSEGGKGQQTMEGVEGLQQGQQRDETEDVPMEGAGRSTALSTQLGQS
jgi:hypothetical protein